jgi:hypothetical protein
MPVLRIILSIFLLLLTTLGGGVWAHEAKEPAMTAAAANAGRAFRAVIEFGHEGGNLRPYKIGIDADGRVKVLEGGPQLKTRRISTEKVRELVLEASDKSLWESSAAAGAAATKKVLPDFGFVYIKVRAVDGRHSVVLDRHGQPTGTLGSFYEQLSDLVLAQP